MDEFNDKILLYSVLDADDQAAVDAYLEAHPELEPLRDRGIALGRLIDAAPRLLRSDPDDEALAHYLVTTRTSPAQPAPEPLREAYERIERRLETDAELRGRLDALEERYRRLDAASDPAAQFERLTGRRLASTMPSERAADAPRPTMAARRGADRPAARIYRIQSQLLRWGIAAVLAGVVTYGLLYVIGVGLQPPLEKLAWASEEALSVEGYAGQFRGEAPAGADDGLTADAAYLQGVARMREAQVTTLGLFPRFHERPLEHAEALFRVAAADETAPFVQNEARYLLGKVLLARGRPDEARAVLQEVVASGRNKTAEAQALLDALPPA